MVGGGGDGDRWLWWCVRETKRGVERKREKINMGEKEER